MTLKVGDRVRLKRGKYSGVETGTIGTIIGYRTLNLWPFRVVFDGMDSELACDANEIELIEETGMDGRLVLGDNVLYVTGYRSISGGHRFTIAGEEQESQLMDGKRSWEFKQNEWLESRAAIDGDGDFWEPVGEGNEWVLNDEERGGNYENRKLGKNLDIEVGPMTWLVVRG